VSSKRDIYHLLVSHGFLKEIKCSSKKEKERKTKEERKEKKRKKRKRGKINQNGEEQEEMEKKNKVFWNKQCLNHVQSCGKE